MDVLSDVVTAMRTGRPLSARTERRAPWGLRFSASDAAGFHVVLQGSCWLVPPQGEPLRVGLGDVVFLPRVRGVGLADDPSTPLQDIVDPGTSVRLPEPTGDGEPITVLLCGAYLLDRVRPHPLLTELPDVVHLPARVGRQGELRSAVDLLGAELDRPRQGSAAVVTALLDMLLLYTLRAWLDERAHHEPDTGWAAALHDPAVNAALQALHEDPAHPWTVSALADRAGLSRAAFARRFTSLVGRPPLKYLTWWRMIVAARLLRDGDALLTAVAQRAGYTSEFAFAKAFKREYGTAPGRYRQQAGSASITI